MDIDSIKNQVSNLTLYDIKAGWRKAQNAVMNYTEMESKVREATNNEPWGCSAKDMQEIANGTFNYAQLNEIMPMIYKRFTEKSAEEWRQIYKALQLLEYLIKNGSERVIDDARSHLSLLKMLRQFHFIDQNGKDQGMNVRNRAKELSELLGDVEKIRSERKKARATRGKYGGVEGGAGSLGGSSRYGGFSGGTAAAGSFGGYSGGVYGDGGGFGGNADQDDYLEQTQTRRERFDEYDEYDEGAVAAPGRRKADQTAAGSSRAAIAAASKPQPAKPKEPEVDLFDFGDEPVPPPQASNGGMMGDFGGFQSSATAAGDDDFDDFQSATSPMQHNSASPTTTTFAQPAPIAPPTSHQQPSIANIMSSISPPPSATTGSATSTPGPNYGAFKAPPPPPKNAQTLPQQQQPAPGFNLASPKPSGYVASGPNYFTSIQAQNSTPTASTPGLSTPGLSSAASTTSASSGAPKAKPAAGGDPFANLAGFGGAKKGADNKGQSKGPSMADMAKQKSSASIWGPPAASSAGQGQQGGSGGGASNDLLGL